MYKDIRMQTLFDENSDTNEESDLNRLKNEPKRSEIEDKDVRND